MTEIPTMDCENCGGKGWFICASPYPCDARHDCVECRSTGRRERPPLTPDEIAALPDGARVVVQGGRVITIESAGARLCVLLDFYARGVWLAGDSGEG